MKAMHELDKTRFVWDSRVNAPRKVLRSKYGYHISKLGSQYAYSKVTLEDLQYLTAL
jgi:hypothetical protein